MLQSMPCFRNVITPIAASILHLLSASLHRRPEALGRAAQVKHVWQYIVIIPRR